MCCHRSPPLVQMTPMETNDLCDIADVNEASVVTSILARFLGGNPSLFLAWFRVVVADNVCDSRCCVHQSRTLLGGSEP
jgi:hypothetical protein